MYEPALAGADMDEVDAFWKAFSTLSAQVSAARYTLDDAMESVATMQQMLAVTAAAPGELDEKLHSLHEELYELDEALNGNKSVAEIGNYEVHRVTSWLSHASRGVSNSSYGPTPAHRQSLGYAAEVFAPLRARLSEVIASDIPALRKDLQAAGAPWGAGQPISAN
jgi:hypothetical protein